MQQRRSWGEKIVIPKEEWFFIYKHLSKEQPRHILLESGRGGRYSIIGLKPFAVLEGRYNRLKVTNEFEAYELEGNPLHLMRTWMSQYKAHSNPHLPDFQGGAIGFISYDYIRHVEHLPSIGKDDLDMPNLYFLVFDDVFVYDHHKEELWVIVNDELSREKVALERLDLYKSQWIACAKQEQTVLSVPYEPSLEFSMSEGAFIEAVEKIQAYIGQGDVFQVNLSVRQSQSLGTPPIHIYEKLREINPSPYMGYMQTPEFQIVSSSPELLIKKRGDEVSTRPIAGTRSRGRTDEEDQQLADELIHNEKERAEHVMLVDLERNDLGRVCEYGTVYVDEFMVIEKYSHVMHIVSNVKGKLQSSKDYVDIIDAVFPGGTITGAPKVRTMEIIEELEPVRRGLYTGSIGWIGFNEDMELNIVIRTLVAKEGKAHVQAGAGIVIDSNPIQEYKESLKKATALWKAKEKSEKELSEGEKR
ncbi:anthranilate synthase component I family protein [Priestia abyssalis]|uniref:anthranilate synthase component I family protein n=1 Tax=Priestia abyssalis TaxID=1221450 RepID=UPI000995792E|nr:anthranilate synthase component I family protein [Priestia abyssalis]